MKPLATSRQRIFNPLQFTQGKTLRRVAEIVVFVLLMGIYLDYDLSDSEKTISVGGPWEFTSQDLSRHGYVFSRMQITETLVRINVDGSIVPNLATDWLVSKDGLEWRFKIRESVLFHNGELLTPQAVLESLQAAFVKPGPLSQAPILSLSLDGDFLLVRLSERYRSLLSLLGHYSTGIVAKPLSDSGKNAITLIGTGPYKLTQFEPPHKLVTHIHQDYWGQVASIESARYLTGHRAESRALQAKAFNSDIIYTLDPASQELLKSVDKVRVHREITPRTILLKMNNALPMFNHQELRLALSLAIDRTAIADNIIRVPGSEAYQMFSPSLKGWHLKDLEASQMNIELASKLLDKHGWRIGESGIREKDGTRYSLTLVTYADRPELTVIATALQAQWRAIGVEVNIEVVNSGAIPASHHSGSFEMALIARNLGWLYDPLPLLLEDNYTYLGSDWGHMNWSSDVLDQLLKQMNDSVDDENYYTLAQQVAHLLVTELPQIPVLFSAQHIAVNERIQGFRFDPFESDYFLNEMRFSDGN